LPVVQLAV